MEKHIMPVSNVQGIAKHSAREIPADQIDALLKSQYIVLAVSNEWFAAAENLITPTPPIHRPGVYTHTGAWYDGWETRRHNAEPADWVVLRLGTLSGRIAGAEIDTAFFNGNHAPEIAIQGAAIMDIGGDEGMYEEMEIRKPSYLGWETILERQECGPSQRHAWLLDHITEKTYTHVRLLMYPDGGIARFRLYGVAIPVFPHDINTVFELSAMKMGGIATSCSDQHFGTKDNLLLPDRGKDMGDGWETKRSRGEHIDWAIIRLGSEGEIDHVVVDTAHFIGNFPQQVQVFAGKFDKEPTHDDSRWVEILEPQRCGPDREHEYKAELRLVKDKTYTHAKLVIIPDGGVKRFRVFGKRM